LLARDCGATALARDLCLEQFDAYASHHEMSASALSLALQPLVNIARLCLAEGDGAQAFAAIDGLVGAARTGGRVSVFGRTVDFPDPAAGGPADAARRLVELVMATDGMRALLVCGRWGALLEHAEQAQDFGTGLNGPSQAAVIALTALGDPAAAKRLLRSCEVRSTWDATVAGLFTAQLFGDSAALVDDYLKIPTQSETAVSSCRLGLAVAAAADVPGRELLIAELADRTMACGDAYVARDLARSPWSGIVPGPVIDSMREMIDLAWLDGASFTAELAETLREVLGPCRRALGSI
jgi:hypothetical protein